MDVKHEPGREHGIEQGKSRSKWAIVKRAVQQHKVLQCFRTLRQMSDGFLVDFENLKHVCTLGEGACGKVDKRVLHHADGTQSVYAVKHLRSQAKIGEMATMDMETTQRTIERVASLALRSQSSKAALPFPGSSLPELHPVPDHLDDGSGAMSAPQAYPERFTPRSGLVGMPMPPQPLGFTLEEHRDLSEKVSEKEKDAQGSSGDANGETPACLEVDSRASSCFSHRGAAPLPTSAENAQINRIVSKMSAEDRLFMAEMHVMRKLSHPYIIRYLGCGVVSAKGPPGAARQYISIAQECCEGGSLAKLIRRATLKVGGKRMYSYHDAWRWALQTAKALQYMHKSSPCVIHRDLKADNLLLTMAGRAGDIRVMDFGLAKLCGQAQRQNERYIMTGHTGSFLYMAPEVVRCEPYNEKVDIFSLGVIMYELFTMCPIVARIGRQDQGPSNADPHERESFAHRVADGFRLELKPSWPTSLQEIIARCWHDDDKARPCARRLVCMLKKIEPEVHAMDACCKRNVVTAEPRSPVAPAAAGGPHGGCCTIF